LNQNRNNNRRRGRGNNRGGQGGGNQGNRIDSRARGNAPQMLEKYRKLAHDASLNGDRVQTEYYLQFADHYFRVVADSRTQKDEQRPRRDDREHGYEADDYEADEQDHRQPRRDRDDERDDRRDDEGRPSREEGVRATEGDEIDQAEENPFVRESRGPRERSGQRSRGRGRPANDAEAGEFEANGRAPAEDEGSFDPGILPPSIARDEEPAPRRTRGRRTRPVEDEGDEPIEAVS